MEYEKNKIQELEGQIFEMQSILRDNRDKERIYQEILSDINSSIINLFKREEENIRFNFGEEIDYRQCMIGIKEYLDNIKSVYKGKINFYWCYKFDKNHNLILIYTYSYLGKKSNISTNKSTGIDKSE